MFDLDAALDEELEIFDAMNTPRQKSERALELESKGRHVWAKTLFPHLYKHPPAFFHEEYWEWLWCALVAKRDGLDLPDGNSFLSIWFRGGAKSSWARIAPIAEAALVGQGFCLYTSGVQPQANKHLGSISTLMRSPVMTLYYPDISEPKKGIAERDRGWTQEFIYTRSGYVLQAIGLNVGVRGANVDTMRVSMIVPDDVDDKKDSVAVSKNKMDTLLSSVLPTKEEKTIIICAQNLIMEHGCVNQIYTGRVPALATAKISGPHKAVDDLVTRKETQPDGRIRDIVVSGKSTWPFYSLKRAQEDIDTFTLPIFRSECQHDLTSDKEGLVLKHFNDSVHVISEAEFASVFGTREMPRKWYKYWFNDWARTKTERHANVAGGVSVSSQNAPLPGFVFFYGLNSFEAESAPEDVAVAILNEISPIVPGHEGTWADLVEACVKREGLEMYGGSETELINSRRAVLGRTIPRLVSPVLRTQNIRMLRMSHEADGVRGVYQQIFGLPFSGVNPGADGGTDIINHLMQVDYDKPHPFRPHQKGHTRCFIVVKGDEVKPVVSLRGDELHGSDLCRFQFARWRYSAPKLGEMGEVERGIIKLHDDFGNGAMMLFYDGCVVAAPLSDEEKLLAVSPRLQELTDKLQQGKGLASNEEMAFWFARSEAKKRMRPNVRRFDESGLPLTD